MARPKKDEALGASAFIGLRVPPAMRAALEKRAKINGTNIAAEARASIERDLNTVETDFGTHVLMDGRKKKGSK